MSDRPDLGSRRRAQPAPPVSDPIDPPHVQARSAPDRSADPALAPWHSVPRPTPMVVRQFRLSPADDAILAELQAARGDRHSVTTLRWLLNTFREDALTAARQR